MSPSLPSLRILALGDSPVHLPLFLENHGSRIELLSIKDFGSGCSLNHCPVLKTLVIGEYHALLNWHPNYHANGDPSWGILLNLSPAHQCLRRIEVHAGLPYKTLRYAEKHLLNSILTLNSQFLQIRRCMVGSLSSDELGSSARSRRTLHKRRPLASKPVRAFSTFGLELVLTWMVDGNLYWISQNGTICVDGQFGLTS